MKPVRFEDTRGKLRALLQELPDLPDNAVSFLDKDGRPAAFLITPHGLAKMLTEAIFPGPDEEKEKLLKQMDEIADEEWRKLMRPQPDPQEKKFEALFEDPEIKDIFDQYIEEILEDPTETAKATKVTKKAKKPRKPAKS